MSSPAAPWRLLPTSVCFSAATTAFAASARRAILSGLNNLSPPTAEETAMGLEPGCRLMCQCRITKGNVKLDLD